MIGARPVAVTIEQRADDAATQHSGKSLLISLWLERRYNFVTARKAANVQALFIRGTATKARIVWCVSLLDTFFSRVHGFETLGAFAPWRVKNISREGAKTQSQEVSRCERNRSRNLKRCTFPVAV